MASHLQADSDIKQLLTNAKVIALVGYSDNPMRDSYRVGQYLQSVGYTVYPVNPTIKAVDGLKSYPSLADVPEAIDIVDVFRRAEFLSGVVDAAISINAKAVWAQLGVVDADAAQKAVDAGLDVVMNRCIKVEYGRLMR